jgi:predicted RNA-binding protein
MFSINTNWLLTGKGNIFIKEESLIINYKEELHKTIDKLKENDLKSVYHFAKSKEN